MNKTTVIASNKVLSGLRSTHWCHGEHKAFYTAPANWQGGHPWLLHQPTFAQKKTLLALYPWYFNEKQWVKKEGSFWTHNFLPPNLSLLWNRGKHTLFQPVCGLGRTGGLVCVKSVRGVRRLKGKLRYLMDRNQLYGHLKTYGRGANQAKIWIWIVTC